MNGSPLHNYNQDENKVFETPSRKPTQHHCMADKKQFPYRNLENIDLSGCTKQLFVESQLNLPIPNKHSAQNVNAKLFR